MDTKSHRVAMAFQWFAMVAIPLLQWWNVNNLSLWSSYNNRYKIPTTWSMQLRQFTQQLNATIIIWPSVPAPHTSQTVLYFSSVISVTQDDSSSEKFCSQEIWQSNICRTQELSCCIVCNTALPCFIPLKMYNSIIFLRQKINICLNVFLRNNKSEKKKLEIVHSTESRHNKIYSSSGPTFFLERF